MSIDTSLAGPPAAAFSGTNSRAEQEQLARVMEAYVQYIDGISRLAAVNALPGDEAFVRLQNKLTGDPNFKESVAPEAPTTR
jgi:hypothetical protein